jgi:hypothetical protein
MHGFIGVGFVVLPVDCVEVEIQLVAWKPHNRTLICWGFFVVNDNLLVDVEKL